MRPNFPARGVMVVLTTIALLSAMCVGIADASRDATRSERKAILREFRLTEPKLPYPKWSYRYAVRVSTVSRRWASLRVVPRSGYEDVVQPDVASFRRFGRTNGEFTSSEMAADAVCRVRLGGI